MGRGRAEVMPKSFHQVPERGWLKWGPPPKSLYSSELAGAKDQGEQPCPAVETRGWGRPGTESELREAT